MKRFASIVSAVLILAGCSSDRSHELKVYNWSTYIDESLIGEFEQWYEEQTGEPVHVIYQTFDVLETMLSKIEKGHEDYDVVCPSDYIIERMLKSDLLMPLDTTLLGDTPNYISGNISPFIKDYFTKINGYGKDANDYAVGYMWGTTGILYNAKYVTDEEASTWSILHNPKFAGKIFLKDSPRDVSSQIFFCVRQDDLVSGRVTADQLMLDSSDQMIAMVEAYLNEAKQYIAGWEADFGKEQMIKERGWVNVNWSGDSEWAIEEAAEAGVDLRFVTPKEGFTIFFDGWVIPKYAKNVKAANYWINFLCRQDIAIRNSDEIGYVSCVGGQDVLDYFTDESFDPIDVSYFFGPQADSVCMNPVMYPDASDIRRSAMEHDWGDDTAKLIAMWGRVKGSNANATTVVVIVAVAAVLVFFLIRSRVAKSHRKGSGRKYRSAKKK